MKDLITVNNKQSIIPFYDIRRKDESNQEKTTVDILNKYVHPSIREFAERKYLTEVKTRLSYFHNPKVTE
jgi:hypothetical protein